MHFSSKSIFIKVTALDICYLSLRAKVKWKWGKILRIKNNYLDQTFLKHWASPGYTEKTEEVSL